MKTHILLILGLAAVLTATARADGIPEPGIIYYGAITNSAYTPGLFVTNSVNHLHWKIQEASGSALVIITPLQNISNKWSYRFRVPFESEVGGNTKSAGAFALRAAATYYLNTNTMEIAIGTNSFPANIQGTDNLLVTNSAAIRGQVREVNLTVNALAVQSFAGGGSSGGRTNTLVTAGAAQVQTFQFSYVGPHPDGGYQLEWIGAPTNRSYYLLRSTSVATPLDELEVVRQFPPATTPINVFWDTNVVNTTTYFYRLVVP